MAVTQLLFRCEESIVREASWSLDALRSIVSFEYDVAPHETLDLNWAPWRIVQALRALGLEPVSIAAERACSGADVVNAEFPSCLGEVCSEIRFNSPSVVEQLRASLSSTTGAGFVGADLFSAEQCAQVGGANTLGAYLRDHYDALALFYARASAARQVVVTWWD